MTASVRGELVDEVAGIIQDARSERWAPDSSAHTAARRVLGVVAEQSARDAAWTRQDVALLVLVVLLITTSCSTAWLLTVSG